MIKLIHAWYILVILQSLVKSLKFYWKGGRCFSKYVHIRQEKQITIFHSFIVVQISVNHKQKGNKCQLR